MGVLGDPVDGNPTGVMEEAGFEAAGLNWRYLTIRVLPEDLDDAMADVRAFNMRGINLTMPHILFSVYTRLLRNYRTIRRHIWRRLFRQS